MNNEFKEYLTYKTLEQKHSFSHTALVDIALDAGEPLEIEIKNVCAKLSKDLSDRIDGTVSFLDIRKRKFIEMALIQALDDAEEIIQQYLSNDEEWVSMQKTKQTDGSE